MLNVIVLSVVVLSVVMLNVIMKSVVMVIVVMLTIVLLRAFMLSVVILSVVVLIVIVPCQSKLVFSTVSHFHPSLLFRQGLVELLIRLYSEVNLPALTTNIKLRRK
jgi:hypothetical protein